MLNIDEKEVDAFINHAPKEIPDQVIKWKYNENTKSFEFEVEVKTSPGYIARIVGTHNPRNGKTKFALILNEKRIRCLEYGSTAKHRNPNGGLVIGLHKHFWTDQFEDREAYVPQGIDTSDPNKAFISFLKECNIKFTGRISPLPRVTRQMGLDGYDM